MRVLKLKLLLVCVFILLLGAAPGALGQILGDCDEDGDVDEDDYSTFAGCFTGPGEEVSPGCECADLDGDGDADCNDWGLLLGNWTGPPEVPPPFEPCDEEPKPSVPHLKWSQPPIEMDPNSPTPTYWGWDEPSHREILSFDCWGPGWPYQCHGDADGLMQGPFQVSLNDLDILKAALGTGYGDPCYNPCADFDRNLIVGPNDVNILKEWINKLFVPGDCSPWTAGVTATGGTEYYDLFAVSLTPDGNYWDLVEGGAGVLSDPLLSPDPAGASVIDPNTPLGGEAWGFGGLDWGGSTLESDVGAYSIQLMNEPNYYLSVVLDTSTLPEHDDTFASWGTISDIVVRPWDADACDWGAAIVPNWVISPFDPDGGTVVTPGASSSVKLASNDFNADEIEITGGQGIGIWGAAAELPSADGYKVDFDANVVTWDSYNSLGPEPNIPWRIVADDFRCLGTMPVISVHWWGSYVGWDACEPPPIEPEAWRIGFWSNVPAGLDANYSYPEKLLWQIEVRAPRVEQQLVGSDWFPDPCKYSDSCFQYHVEFLQDERFWQHEFLDQTMDDTFWISIAAVYPIGTAPVDYPWGWKTRPWSWMDDAVRFNITDLGAVLDPCSVEPIEDPCLHESYDVAFELNTDPNWIKWEQAYDSIRHWSHYEDELSMATGNNGEPDILRLVADDWPCDTNGPVSAVVWWGSYIGYGYEAEGPWMPLPVKPDYFLLNIWTDVPAGADPCYPFSHPNDIIWEYDAYDYDEVLVGYDKHPEDGEPNEPVFRYSVRLPDPNWFEQDDVNGIYWLSVVAVYDQNVPNYDWGWTNHKHMFNDNAVEGGYIWNPEEWWHWQPLYDQTGASEDMSFMLFTECFACSNPDYANWLYWNKPRCWCYQRQCRGDIDGLLQGPFWVSGNDLILFRLSINKLEAQMPAGGECADFDHKKQGPLWVSGNDLIYFRNYINKMVGFVPPCSGPNCDNAFSFGRVCDANSLPNSELNFWVAP